MKCDLTYAKTDVIGMQKYIKNTHGHTHKNFIVVCENVWKVSRDCEYKNFNPENLINSYNLIIILKKKLFNCL